ncbi:hypothetical protein [Burkholderia cenocepacia]|uniref:hypothetical protein n=1 Tax=Burkholderia cepacia complex TaxID=87882 RepID=UPI00196A8E66|nr:hypothetical protein [Burkholderia cenocepacia]MBN3506333.1 hypothetical protein [Burkholderia cenocepacia]MBR8030396.1 hypothetical protein [Burkholderia cenocepacia]MBR8172202.1 hypothetical protein [Burkholderia cenocepacia]
MYREEDIVHENGTIWVLRDRPEKAYTVCVSAGTHSTVDSAYRLDSDGLSIAIARCDYLAKRHADRREAQASEPTNIIAPDDAFPTCTCGRRLMLMEMRADHTLEQCVHDGCGKRYCVYEPDADDHQTE